MSQLHGGIVTYGKDPEVRGKLWDGQLYVFDERISVPVNQVDPRFEDNINASTSFRCRHLGLRTTKMALHAISLGIR